MRKVGLYVLREVSLYTNWMHGRNYLFHWPLFQVLVMNDSTKQYYICALQAKEKQV